MEQAAIEEAMMILADPLGCKVNWGKEGCKRNGDKEWCEVNGDEGTADERMLLCLGFRII